MNLLTPILDIVANLTGIWRRRGENKNAPDVKEAKKRQGERDMEARITQDVAKRDVEATRKDLAE